MDTGSETFDFIKLVNVKGNIENITPHKIAVVAFIREYGLLKIEGLYFGANKPEVFNSFHLLTNQN